LKTTIDFSAQSFIVSLFSGGLNAHVAHHLFPNICHIHYRHISQIISETARDYGLEYKNKSFLTAISGHFQYLKKLGMDPRLADLSSDKGIGYYISE
jgi:linoleoyl-CoA desaturase